MRIGFCGTRGYARPDLVETFVQIVARKYPDAVIVSGGRGVVDTTAEEAGERCRLEVVSFRPAEGETGHHVELWMNDPKKGEYILSKRSIILGEKSFARACFARNDLIVKGSERIVGYWDLQSRGTAHTLSIAKGAERPRTVYGPTGEQLSEELVDKHVHRVLG